MSERRYHEKEEKEEEKREEKSPEEKSWEEKWRRDPLGTIIWATIFIWAGLVLLASNLGYLSRLIRLRTFIPGLRALEAWAVVFLGAGIIVLVEVIIRVLIPAYRKPISGSLFFAVVLIGIGLGSIFGWNLVWPLILIALGLSIILRGLLRSR